MTPEMRPLFGRAGKRALARAMRTRPLLAFDFDGTLAAIVSHPDDARIDAAIAGRLARLAHLRPLAVVTGRSVGDVTGRLGFTAAYIVGNHGAEEAGRISALDASLLDGLRARIRQQAGELRDAGIDFEDKRYSLALHFRRAADPAGAAARVSALLADLDPALRRVAGKFVENVVLAAAPDKGDAVAALVGRAACDSAVFVGDDVNDESVFERAREDWLTVRVGRDFPQSRAAYFLDGFDDVAPLLDRMLGALADGCV
jgi:trehalose 6-phosphate phosphatase